MSLPKDIARHRLFWTWHRRIGIVAALFTMVGMHLVPLAERMMKLFGTKTREGSFGTLSFYAELLGGVVLWIIGIRILVEYGVLHNLFT